MNATLLARLATFLIAAAGATTAYRAVLVTRRSLGPRNLSLARPQLPVRTVRQLSKQQDEFESLRPETNFGSESVPENQRPVNEYLDITSQPLFGWAATGSQGLLIRLVIFYGAFFGLVCYPISGATFTQEGYLVQKLAASNVGAMFVLFLLLIRLYSGWGYIGQRLSSKVVEFEETGWYDGDWEEKTETELKRDRMLFANEVKPVVDRLKLFTIGSGGLLLVSIISFNVALSAKPMFDQYDPNVLGRLSYDDRLADSAALNTGGRPAYCESRYYRAVANGGMGCD
jgi:Conserved in the green lineage and diatoms 27